MLTQIFHKKTAQFFNVHHIIFDSSGKCKAHPHIYILELGPKDTRGIQQL